MVEITRSLARTLSTVLRRCFRKPYAPFPPVAEVVADTKELRIRVVHSEVALELRQPGQYRPGNVLVPLDALAAVQGRDAGFVNFETSSAGQVVARWEDAGVPQVMAFVVPDAKKTPAFPDMPEKFVSNPPALLTALDQAAQSTSSDATRFALQRLQLRGKKGEVVGTDSKQLLVHSGFDFGWGEDILVPRVAAFGCPELGPFDTVEIGKTATHVAIRFGVWTFFLAIDTEGRYPDFEAILPKASATTCTFGPGDVELLIRSIPKLPGKEQFNKPVTLDLNGQVSLRARGEDQPQVTELLLSGTQYSGNPTRLNLNRDNLSRALQLGFTELRVANPDRPLVCRDERRTFLMMPLDQASALATTSDPIRIASSTNTQPMKVHQPKREKRIMKTPSTNGSAAAPTQQRAETPPAPRNRIGWAALMADAQLVKEAARLTYDRTNQLLTALKRHRKQSQLMASTLKSLKQLQSIDA